MSNTVTSSSSTNTLVEPLQVHLFKNHFTLAAQKDVTFPYQGSLSSLVEGINTLLMDQSVIQAIPEKHLHNLKLVILITDHRYTPVVQQEIRIDPQPGFLQQDLNQFGVDFLGQEWNDELQLDAEAMALPVLVPDLDLDPSPSVLTKKSLENYNKVKYLQGSVSVPTHPWIGMTRLSLLYR